MLVSAVLADILLSLVWRHMRVYCTHVIKIMKTLSCSVARNNDLLTKEETICWLIHTNEAYAHTLYMRMCVYAYAYSRIGLTHITHIFWFRYIWAALYSEIMIFQTSKGTKIGLNWNYIVRLTRGKWLLVVVNDKLTNQHWSWQNIKDFTM